MQHYEAYKSSTIEDVDKIPDTWSELRFRYIFKNSKGLTITKENLQDDGIPCINYGEIHSKYGFEVDIKRDSLKCVADSYLVTDPKSRVNAGDLIFADTSEDVDGAGNFTQVLSDGPAFAGYHTIIARPSRDYNPRFLAYFVESNAFRSQIQRSIKGVKVFSITNAILKNTFIVIPSTFEQKRIAEYLDSQTTRIDSLIKEKENFITLLEEKRQALISHVVTKGLDDKVEMKDSGVGFIGEIPKHWVLNRLKQNLKKPMMYGANESAEDENPEHPRYIRITDMRQDGSLKDSTFKSLKPNIAAPYILDDGDVLLARSGATVGKSFIQSSKFGACCFAGYLIKVSVNRRLLLPEFLYYVTNSHFYWEYIAGSQIQATIQNVSAEKYANLPIPLPPIEEQQKIIVELEKTLSKLNSIADEVQSSIKLLKEHRSALISAAVTGKIDVREEV